MNKGLQIFNSALCADLEAEYNREEQDPDYNNFEEFGNQEKPNLARTKAAQGKVFDKYLRIYAVAEILHRERAHGEDHKEEKEVLSSDFIERDWQTAEALSFWRD